ncbi:MAG TPA: MATE family efflux transporter [Dehalococcoidales bacterium]|nr:MATE family efflux transporter [Dehalococcoidales bacterium]
MPSEAEQNSTPAPINGDSESASIALGRRGGRGNRVYADLSEGSIPRHIFRLAWPQVIEQTLNIIDQVIDMFWAGRLPGGFRALAGLGVAQTFSQLGFMSRQGLEQSTRAMVSQAVGAGNLPLANRVALQAFAIMGVYSVIMILIGLFLTDIALNAIGASEAVHAQAALYMKIQFIGMTGMTFRMTAASILQASGDVLVPLRATTITRVLHLVMSPLFMFGWIGFPEMGLAGAAMANLLSQAVGASINMYMLFSGNTRLHLTMRGFRLDRGIIWRLVKIGAPASATGMERALAQVLLLKIVSPFGDIAMAGYGMTRRLEMFANFGGMGVGQATGIMVGQNLGAKRPDRARRSVAWGLVFVTAFKLIIAIPLVVFPTFVVLAFTKEPAVVSLTTDWLRILALAAVFMGLGVVFQQSFNVAGDTLTVMMVTLAEVFIEVPLGWLLSHPLGFGPLGIAWGNVIGMVLRASIFVPLYFRGRWLTRTVI